MSTRFCSYEGTRDEAIVAYLYDDSDPAARAAFESHLAGCAVCREELAGLRAVRAGMAAWTPPGIRSSSRVLDFPPPGKTPRIWSALADIPAWVQVAAALVVLGISARVANVEVKYDRDGFAVRTGVTASAVGPSFSSGAAPTGGAPDLKVGPTSAPWTADLTALEQQLRTEFRAATAPAGDQDVLRRVRALINESERNQRRELALRVAEVAREGQAQRVADLQRIQRTFNVLENTNRGAIVRQGVLLNNLAVKVSQQQ